LWAPGREIRHDNARDERTLAAVATVTVLGLSHNLLYPAQKWFARKNDIFPSLDEPSLPDDPLLIH